jgi:hypothetical protein
MNSPDGWRQDYGDAFQAEYNLGKDSPFNAERFIRRYPENIQQHHENINYFRNEKRASGYAAWNGA